MATDDQTILAVPFRENRPRPPLPSTSCPDHCSACRNEAALAISVPSIIRLAAFAIVPSKASFKGAPATRILMPERLPESVAAKSARLMLVSRRCERHVACPVAEKAREMAGHASD